MKQKQAIHQSKFSEIKTLLEKEDDFLITTHINPDGDCITSVLTMGRILQVLGKKYIIVLSDPVPKKFKFLPDVETIKHFDTVECSLKKKVAIVLDASNKERFGNVMDCVDSCNLIVNIDHHPSNTFFGTLNLVDPEESSSVEIVYHLIKYWGLDISPEMATMIYTGVMCDTGRFLFPNTTYRSMIICSEMIQKGASPELIGDQLYFRKSFATMKALGDALSTLELHFDGRLACVELACHCINSDEPLDTEGFVDYLMMVDGTEVVFLMLEKEPGEIKISLRAKNYVNVNDVAANFGGGGHARAAGCVIKGTFSDAKNKLLKAIEPSFSD